jgi:hypothetical protein
MMHDHFRADAEGHRFEVVARLTLWGAAEYSLLIDGLLGDTLYQSTWGVFMAILGYRQLVLEAERDVPGADGSAGAASGRPSEAITRRRQEVTGRRGADGISKARLPASGGQTGRLPADPPAGAVMATAEILQGWTRTKVRLWVNGVPVPMLHLL